MKKIFIAFFIILNAINLFAKELKDDFYVKVVSGEPAVLEKLYVEKFKQSFYYHENFKVFIVSASNEDRIAFIDFLKSKDLQVSSGNNPYEYLVSIVDTSPKDRFYTVDTSAFSPDYLLVIQKMLGQTIKGGRADEVKVNDEKIPQIKSDFDKLGFVCDFADGKITIRETTLTMIVECNENMEKTIAELLSQYAGNVRKLQGKYRFDIIARRLPDLITKLTSLKEIEKVTIPESNKLLLVPSAKTEYRVRIYVASKRYANSLIDGLKSTHSYNINGAFAVSSSGMLCVELNVDSYDATQSDISKSIYSQAIRFVSRLRAQDIKISKVENN